MVKARWAVACLLAAVLFGLAGCATGSAGKSHDSKEEVSGTVVLSNTAKMSPPAASVGTITEEYVMDTPQTATEAFAADRAGDTGGPSTQQPSAPPSGSEYKLGPEDQIRVSVWENRELTMELVIRPDGKISMPLIQDVTADGLTSEELAGNIREKLLAFIKEPQVSVIVLQVNAPKFYVIGNVVRPGTYPLRGEMSVLQALSLAGGFTQFASPRSIKLIRNTGGKQQIRKVNYYNVIDEGGEGNYLMKAGDTLVIP